MTVLFSPFYGRVTEAQDDDMIFPRSLTQSVTEARGSESQLCALATRPSFLSCSLQHFPSSCSLFQSSLSLSSFFLPRYTSFLLPNLFSSSPAPGSLPITVQPPLLHSIPQTFLSLNFFATLSSFTSLTPYPPPGSYICCCSGPGSSCAGLKVIQ